MERMGTDFEDLPCMASFLSVLLVKSVVHLSKIFDTDGTDGHGF